MVAEFVRRGIGLTVVLLAGLYIKAVGIEKARISLWVCAGGFVLTLA